MVDDLPLSVNRSVPQVDVFRGSDVIFDSGDAAVEDVIGFRQAYWCVWNIVFLSFCNASDIFRVSILICNRKRDRGRIKQERSPDSRLDELILPVPIGTDVIMGFGRCRSVLIGNHMLYDLAILIDFMPVPKRDVFCCDNVELGIRNVRVDYAICLRDLRRTIGDIVYLPKLGSCEYFNCLILISDCEWNRIRLNRGTCRYARLGQRILTGSVSPDIQPRSRRRIAVLIGNQRIDLFALMVDDRAVPQRDILGSLDIICGIRYRCPENVIGFVDCRRTVCDIVDLRCMNRLDFLGMVACVGNSERNRGLIYRKWSWDARLDERVPPVAVGSDV